MLNQLFFFTLLYLKECLGIRYGLAGMCAVCGFSGFIVLSFSESPVLTLHGVLCGAPIESILKSLMDKYVQRAWVVGKSSLGIFILGLLGFDRNDSAQPTTSQQHQTYLKHSLNILRIRACMSLKMLDVFPVVSSCFPNMQSQTY